MFKNNDLLLANYEITEPRLSKALVDNENPTVKFARIPSNAELGKPETWGVYATRRFPYWSICTAKNNHKKKSYIIYKHISNTKKTCPECPAETSPKKAYDKAGREAIRFITACENGHMNDIDWKWQVCRNNSCNSQYLYMNGSGAIKNIKLNCPVCQSNRSLIEIYRTTETCKGFNQENWGEQEECDKKSKVVHRGATYLRFPELSTSLKIEPNQKIDKFIEEDPQLRLYVELAQAQDSQNPAEKFKEFVSLTPSITGLKKRRVSELDNYELNLSIKRIIEIQNRERTHEILKYEEFETLQRAALNGVPPTSDPPNYIPNLEVRSSDVRTFEMPATGTTSNLKLRITPIRRLKAIIAQTSYRRMDPDKGKRISCGHKDENAVTWYPAIELLGEGLFIDLSPDTPSLSLVGEPSNNWKIADDVDYPPPPMEKKQIRPLFVWWHTLSHRLINSLSLNSGYGSASIRERVYLSRDGKEGGVLLYTTQTGGDGTHGGLVSQANRFDKIMDHAFHSIDGCSNDPVCGSSSPSSKILNGAACFSCLLISETSCEFRNFGLDRNVLRITYG